MVATFSLNRYRFNCGRRNTIVWIVRHLVIASSRRVVREGLDKALDYNIARLYKQLLLWVDIAVNLTTVMTDNTLTNIFVDGENTVKKKQLAL